MSNVRQRRRGPDDVRRQQLAHIHLRRLFQTDAVHSGALRLLPVVVDVQLVLEPQSRRECVFRGSLLEESNVGAQQRVQRVGGFVARLSAGGVEPVRPLTPQV